MIFHPKHQKVYVPLVVENTAIKQIEENKFFKLLLLISKFPGNLILASFLTQSRNLWKSLRTYHTR